MANPTYKLIASVTVGVGGSATIDFTSIPATYTDLIVKLSGRSTTTDEYATISFNGVTTNLSGKYLYGNGTAGPTSGSIVPLLYSDSSGATANTFGNGEAYIPNYAGSNNKSMSIDTIDENNTASNSMILQAGLWSSSSAINRITLTHSGSGIFVQNSTAYLYGISNS